MKPLLAGLFSLAALSFSPFAHAQALVDINWGAGAMDITDDSDVFMGGTIVQAYNIGTPSATAATIGGLTFDAVGVPTDLSVQSVNFGSYVFAENPGNLGSTQVSNAGRFGLPSGALSDDYQTLVSDGAYATFPGTITLTMDSLEIGHLYAFQWWSSDADGFFNHTSATGTLSLSANTSSSEGGLGQYGLGVFTATDTAMDIQFWSDDDRPLINGFQLRDLGTAPIPEPSTYAALAGVAALGFVLLRRRRVA